MQTRTLGRKQPAAIELTGDDLRGIHDMLAPIAVQGDRYPAHLAARVGR